MNIWDTFLKKPPTVVEVDARIAELQQQVEQMNGSRQTIAESMAEQWGSDTKKLEQEYAGIDAKVLGAEKTLERLQAVRAEAERRDSVEAYRAELKNFKAAYKKRNRAVAERDEAKQQLQDAQRKLEAVMLEVGENNHQLNMLETRLARAGVSAEEQEALLKLRQDIGNAS